MNGQPTEQDLRARAQLEADEYWDVYDENRILTGKKHRRGDPMPPGEYHMDVHVCIFNSKGQLLIQQRQPFKRGWPNLWDITVGGSALSGDTSRQAAEREVWEELGIRLDLSGVRPIFTMNFKEGFDDYYIVEKDVDLSQLRLQAEEVKQVKWVDKEEALRMQEEGILAPYYFLEQFFDVRKMTDCRIIPEGEIRVQKAKEKQLLSWMNLLEIVKWNFPGLETKEAVDAYQETVVRHMKRGTAVCAMSGKRVVGILLYSLKQNRLCCMAVHPNFRRQKIASRMVELMMKDLDVSRDVVVETFREDDEKGIAPRAFYRTMGFEEGRLYISDDGHPVQEWVLRRE